VRVRRKGEGVRETQKERDARKNREQRRNGKRRKKKKRKKERREEKKEEGKGEDGRPWLTGGCRRRLPAATGGGRRPEVGGQSPKPKARRGCNSR